MLKKIKHPRILQIKEFNDGIDNQKEIFFVSESVGSCLLYENNLENDEIQYIGKQILDVLSFLNNKAKLRLTLINKESIALKKDLSIKICMMNFVEKIGSNDNVNYDWKSICSPDLNNIAPEIFMHKDIGKEVDVFSFGVLIASLYSKTDLFNSKNDPEIMEQEVKEKNLDKLDINDKMKSLLQKCISFKPEDRPKLEDINNAEAFNSIHIKVYDYFDNILTKDNKEKFEFFKCIQSPNLFSKRITKYKFLPILMNETLNDKRYAPVTIPLIIQIGSNLEQKEFNFLIVKLGKLLYTTKPPEVMISVFSILNILIDKIENGKHFQVLFPIFRESILSNDIRLQNFAAEFIPLLLTKISSQEIIKSVIPILTKLITKSEDPTIISNAISSLSETISIVGTETFVNIVISKIQDSLTDVKTEEIASSIIYLIEKLDLNNNITFKVIPLISSLLLNSHILTNEEQLKLVNFAQEIVSNYMPVKNDKIENCQKKELVLPKQMMSLREDEDESNESFWNESKEIDKPKKRAPIKKYYE